jgi:penicillin amidase
MIVHSTQPIEAYGIYPGGQSGNPGSFYYDNLIAKWNLGQYNKINIHTKDNISDALLVQSFKAY